MSAAEHITHNLRLDHIELKDAMQQLGGLPSPVRFARSGGVFSLIFEASSLITSVVFLWHLSAYGDQSGLSLETPSGLRLCVSGINKLRHGACLCACIVMCVCVCVSE